MSNPTMKPGQRWAINSAIVFGVFLIVDLLFHFFWPTPNPYMDSFFEKVIYTSVFSALYAHIYDKASQEFHIGSHKVLNGLVFSLLFCVIIFMAVGLMLWLGSALYIYILHGFHGAPPPPDTREAVETGTQIVLAGTVLSSTGKTEDNPR